ncbi:hypothetical protein AGMMS50255_6740 [Spirochaetia bacterium]|nr:hypothetical protein AGMMS50255_6740 [Spirochaetia bacterium]
MMEIATLTSRGQITIPKKVREKMGVEEGDQVIFSEAGSGRFIVENAEHLENRKMEHALNPPK